MKRLPEVMSFFAVVVLSVSLAYWAMQLFTVPQRPLAAAQLQDRPPASLEAAGALFGGQSTVAAVSQYQLRGVIAAADGHGSMAILALDNKPAMVLAVGATVVPGVTVKEVTPRYVLLLDGGIVKRVEMMVATAKGGAVAAMQAPVTQMPTEVPIQNPTPAPTEAPVQTPARPNQQEPAQQVQPVSPPPPPPPAQAPPSGRMGMGARGH